MNDSLDRQDVVLVVDDTPTNVGVLLELLRREGYRVLVAENGESALEQVGYAPPNLILLDVMMPGTDGFETCRRLKADPSTREIPVIFMTACGDSSDRIAGFAVGAADYVVKPLEHDEVLARVRAHIQLQSMQTRLRQLNQELEAKVAERTATLREALDEVERLKNRLQVENRYLQDEIREQNDHHEIVGSSALLRAVLQRIDLVAPTDASVLISGETGTGKELLARAVHARSRRNARPMVKLNCAAISAGLVESELFGHVKGAFTGAADRRIGRFELADGGTLFLDEVSELPIETQAKLLRVLQEGEFEPVGSSSSRQVDVRIIAATNRNLGDAVAAGRFRSDLYYRLNVFPLELPPLRERRDDIVPLAEHFLGRLARRLGKPVTSIAADTRIALEKHDWPGNVRDLKNTIERALVLCRDGPLTIDWELGADAARPSVAVDGASERTAPPEPGGPQTLEALERRHIIATLRSAGGVIEGPRGAASTLGMKPSTLRYRMKKLGIERPAYR